MNKHESPQPRKFTPQQETEHRAHEARIDYVAEHRDDFLRLVAIANGQSLQEAVETLGCVARDFGRSFDEVLYLCWRSHYHPNAAHINFTVRPINFAAYQSVMAAVSA